VKRKQILSILLVCLMIAVLVAGCGGGGGAKKTEAPKAPERVFINIATGGTAGTYYPLGGAVAEILNRNIPGMNASAQSTGASVANINLLNDGKVDFAFVQNDITYYAANGMEMFKDKKVENLRGLAVLYPETVQIITLERSGIKSIADIKGKRVAVGAAGSGTEANARQILAAHGITYEDIRVQYLSFGEAANGIKDGNVDVGFVTAGFPTAAVQDIGAQHKVILIPVDDSKVNELIKQYPFYSKNVIPADVYKQDKDVPAIAVNAMLVATTKLSDEMGYNIVKSIYTNLDRIQAAHAIGRIIVKDTATKAMPITVNPGAEKFFKEK
jgi:TRAP transporter TAXI family solute receptor